MCRLLAMTSNQVTDLKYSFKRISEFARRKKHGDGWGIAWLDEQGKFQVAREEESIWNSQKAKSLIEKLRSKLIVVHARKGQNKSKQNCHPFLRKAIGQEWIFAHNGSLQIAEPKNHKPEGETDSEQFFCNFLDTIEEISNNKESKFEPKIVEEALRETIKSTQVKTALNSTLASKNFLYALKLYKVKPYYYTLYWLERIGSTKEGKKLGKAIGEKAIIISSEKLTSEAWKPIKNLQFLRVKVGQPETACFVTMNT